MVGLTLKYFFSASQRKTGKKSMFFIFHHSQSLPHKCQLSLQCTVTFTPHSGDVIPLALVECTWIPGTLIKFPPSTVKCSTTELRLNLYIHDVFQWESSWTLLAAALRVQRFPSVLVTSKHDSTLLVPADDPAPFWVSCHALGISKFMVETKFLKDLQTWVQMFPRSC